MLETNKADVGALVAQELNVNKTEGLRIVNIVLDAIKEAVSDTGSVRLAGFGRFHSKHVNGRASALGNIKDGENLVIMPYNRLHFTASADFKKLVNPDRA